MAQDVKTEPRFLPFHQYPQLKCDWPKIICDQHIGNAGLLPLFAKARKPCRHRRCAPRASRLPAELRRTSKSTSNRSCALLCAMIPFEISPFLLSVLRIQGPPTLVRSTADRISEASSVASKAFLDLTQAEPPNPTLAAGTEWMGRHTA